MNAYVWFSYVSDTLLLYEIINRWERSVSQVPSRWAVFLFTNISTHAAYQASSGRRQLWLAIGSKVYAFNPGRQRWVFEAIQVRNTTSFGGEAKPSAPSRKILRHVKYLFEVWTKMLRKAKFISFTKFSLFSTRWLCLLGFPKSSGGRIKRFYLLITFHYGSACSYITWVMNNRPVASHSSET
jgi:hypothetical protein